MATRNSSIGAKLQIDRREWTAGLQQARKDMEQLASGADAIRRRQAEAQSRHVQKLIELEAAHKNKSFGPQTREDFNAGQKALRLERERHALEMANLERRGRMEQKLDENAARRRREMQDTGLMHGPQQRQYDPVRLRLSGTDWSHLNRTATGSNPTAMFQQMGRGATNAGMGMLMLSQTIDDLQYGIKGVVNNIAPLVMALGGGTGLAGVLTIGAVAVNQGVQLWDKWNSTTALAEANAEALASRQEQLARMTAQAAAAAEEQNTRVRFFMDRTAESRGLFDAMISREERLLDLEKELALARASGLQGTDAVAARQRAETDYAVAAGQKALDIAERRLEIDKENAGALADEYDAARNELEELQKTELAFRSPREANRITYLETLLPGLRENRDAANLRFQQSTETVNAARQRVGPEAEIRAQINAEEMAQAKKEENQKANAAAWEDTKSAILSAAGRAKEAWDAVAAAAARAAAQQKQRDDITGDLQIARLRARGKNKQADKLQGDKNEAARAAEFQAAGIPEKEARQERRDKDDAQYLARTGHRKMRGATNAGSYAGLDSMKSRGMSDEWNFDKLDAAKKDQRRPLKSQLDREAGKPSITPDAFSGKSIAEADKLLPVLKAIQAAVEKSVPAAADKLKPR